MIRKIAVLLVFASVAQAGQIADYSFKSPSFTGVGYSSHVLLRIKSLLAEHKYKKTSNRPWIELPPMLRIPIYRSL